LRNRPRPRRPRKQTEWTGSCLSRPTSNRSFPSRKPASSASYVRIHGMRMIRSGSDSALRRRPRDTTVVACARRMRPAAAWPTTPRVWAGDAWRPSHGAGECDRCSGLIDRTSGPGASERVSPRWAPPAVSPFRTINHAGGSRMSCQPGSWNSQVRAEMPTTLNPRPGAGAVQKRLRSRPVPVSHRPCPVTSWRSTLRSVTRS
jgi:hypothetical protein